jgi:hypothetical protein
LGLSNAVRPTAIVRLKVAVITLFRALACPIPAHGFATGFPLGTDPSRIKLARVTAPIARNDVAVIALFAPHDEAVATDGPACSVGDWAAETFLHLASVAAAVTRHRPFGLVVHAVVAGFGTSDQAIPTFDRIDAGVPGRGAYVVRLDLVAGCGAAIAGFAVAVVAALLGTIDQAIPAVGHGSLAGGPSFTPGAAGSAPTGLVAQAPEPAGC